MTEPICYMEDPEGTLRRWKPSEELLLLRRLAHEARTVMQYLEEDGAGVVAHLMDDDCNPGQRLREALAEAGLPVRERIE